MILPRLMRVVGADHQRHQPGRETVESAMLNPPQDILGTVPGETQVQHLRLLERIRVPAPGMGDRVPDHHQVEITRFCLGKLLFIERRHELLQLRRHRDHR